MGLLKPVGDVGYLKGGFLGFNKSGKTFTMALLAVAVKRHFNLAGPIAMYDTEGGSEYIGPIIKALTGESLLVVKSRSLDDLSAVTQESVAEQVAVLLAESMTHVWRNLCDSYLEQVNVRRTAARQAPRRNLEFQDWGPLKGIWNGRWSDLYLNAPLHILIAGRAGYEYDMQENEETHKKELIKTGVKMKTEGEFGFEPSLLVEMERESAPDGRGGFVVKRRATVIGDRFGVIDAKTGLFGDDDPSTPLTAEQMLERVFDFFRPHVELLRPGTPHAPSDTTSRTETGADLDGDTDWAHERRTRVILCEEIAGALVKYGLDGQSAEAKRGRLELLESVFGTRSWTAVESTPSDRLRDGLATIRRRFEPAVAAAAPTPPPDGPGGGVSEEEAERRKKLARVQGLETRSKATAEKLAALRTQHLGAGTDIDLAAAGLDALTLYAEALEQLIPAGNGRGRAAKTAAASDALAGDGTRVPF